jgi:hypothetical protein
MQPYPCRSSLASRARSCSLTGKTLTKAGLKISVDMAIISRYFYIHRRHTGCRPTSHRETTMSSASGYLAIAIFTHADGNVSDMTVAFEATAELAAAAGQKVLDENRIEENASTTEQMQVHHVKEVERRDVRDYANGDVVWTGADGCYVKADANTEAVDAVSAAAAAVNAWDKQDIDELADLLTAYQDACAEAEFDIQHGGVDMADLPSADMPDDVDTSYPVWAMDVHGGMLVGSDAQSTMTLVEYRDEQAA